jgi:glycosyltransferase involved in cell wall biosynthesis
VDDPRVLAGQQRLRVLFCNWRDTRNPEGGGSEVYVENVATALADAGHDVVILCASHGAAPDDEVRGGVRFVRRGSKLGVYPAALAAQARRALGRFDVVVDVQNGIPFASTLVPGTPVVVLVHHVHREQWPVVYGPLRSRIGWFLESRVAPRLYRSSRYVAVSHVTRDELIGLGVDADRVAVVHNGCVPATATRMPHDDPTVLVVGRLVPHKRVEHVLRAAARLRLAHPRLRVRVVGDGWWAAELAAEASRLGVDDIVEFTGFVDEETKQREMAEAWVLALPSLKEGWGLVVMEAASLGVPTVAYRHAGGVAESVVDGTTGLLVDDEDAFVAALDGLLDDAAARERLGAAARAWSVRFSWEAAAESFASVLLAAAGRPTEAADEVHVLPGHLRHLEHPLGVEPGAGAPPASRS